MKSLNGEDNKRSNISMNKYKYKFVDDSVPKLKIQNYCLSFLSFPNTVCTKATGMWLNFEHPRLERNGGETGHRHIFIFANHVQCAW